MKGQTQLQIVSSKMHLRAIVVCPSRYLISYSLRPLQSYFSSKRIKPPVTSRVLGTVAHKVSPCFIISILSFPPLSSPLLPARPGNHHSPIPSLPSRHPSLRFEFTHINPHQITAADIVSNHITKRLQNISTRR